MPPLKRRFPLPGWLRKPNPARDKEVARGLNAARTIVAFESNLQVAHRQSRLSRGTIKQLKKLIEESELSDVQKTARLAAIERSGIERFLT